MSRFTFLVSNKGTCIDLVRFLTNLFITSSETDRINHGTLLWTVIGQNNLFEASRTVTGSSYGASTHPMGIACRQSLTKEQEQSRQNLIWAWEVLM
ncbi:hypothetical protein PoB_004497200 [Plakobranchus ocellatus]|uniref:Uncharacterized protein n=1 Tax=Plakobranchus ocellatus TaxID=259542 RepID=A0AAV4BHM8_9GAST|nr:hypothetical protein PoB_004497200 [Plakobranchus ocellatus]